MELTFTIPTPKVKGYGYVIRAKLPDACYEDGGALIQCGDEPDEINGVACDVYKCVVCGHLEYVRAQ